MLYKEILRKNHSWLSFLEKLEGTNDLDKTYLAWMIISNKETLKKYVEIISPQKKFSSKDEFKKLLLMLIRRHKEEQLINKCLNKSNRELLVDHRTFSLFYDIFILIGENNFKKLIEPNLFAFNNPHEFNKYLNNFKFWHNKWNKEHILLAIENYDLNAQLCYQEENMIIIKIEDFEAARILGTHSWCISREEKFFKSHKNEIDNLYFLYDFNKEQYNKTSLIGVTIPDGPIIRFKFSFNSANEAYKEASLISKFERIFYKEPFDKDKFKKNVSLMKDPYDQFVTFYDMKYYNDAEFLFKQFLMGREDDYFLLIISYVLFETKNHEFLFQCLENFEWEIKEKEYLMNAIGELIVHMMHEYDREFMKKIFKKVNNEDLEICFLRKMVEKDYMAESVGFFLEDIIKDRNRVENYIVSYIFRIGKEDVLKRMCKKKIFNNLDLNTLKEMLNNKDLSLLKQHIKHYYNKSDKQYLNIQKLFVIQILEKLLSILKN